MEAMGQGVIPLATAIESGIPELVTDGANGFIRPVGDIDGFAAILADLYERPERRVALHEAAYATILTSRFAIESVAARYIEVFERILRDRADGSYVRPKPCRPGSRTGDIIPPPHLQYAPDELRRAVGGVLLSGAERFFGRVRLYGSDPLRLVRKLDRMPGYGAVRDLYRSIRGRPGVAK
jgi:hypothetical protein